MSKRYTKPVTRLDWATNIATILRSTKRNLIGCERGPAKYCEECSFHTNPVMEKAQKPNVTWDDNRSRAAADLENVTIGVPQQNISMHTSPKPFQKDMSYYSQRNRVDSNLEPKISVKNIAIESDMEHTKEAIRTLQNQLGQVEERTQKAFQEIQIHIIKLQEILRTRDHEITKSEPKLEESLMRKINERYKELNIKVEENLSKIFEKINQDSEKLFEEAKDIRNYKNTLEELIQNNQVELKKSTLQAITTETERINDRLNVFENLLSETHKEFTQQILVISKNQEEMKIDTQAEIIQKLKEDMEKTQEELKNIKICVVQLSEIKDNLIKNHSELTELIQNSESKIQTIVDEKINLLKSEKTRENSELMEKILGRLADLEKKSENDKTLIEKMDEKITNLETENNALKSAINETKQKTELFEKNSIKNESSEKISEIIAKNQDIENRMNLLDTKISENNAEILKINENNTKINTKFNEIEAKLKTDNEKIENEIKSATQNSSKNEEMLQKTEFDKKINEIDQKISTLNIENNNVKNNIENVKTQNEKLANKADSLENSLKNQEKIILDQNNKFVADLSNQNEKIENQNSKIAAQNALIENLNKTVKNLNDKTENSDLANLINVKLENQDKKINNFETILENQKLKIETQNTQLENLNKNITEFKQNEKNNEALYEKAHKDMKIEPLIADVEIEDHKKIEISKENEINEKTVKTQEIPDIHNTEITKTEIQENHANDEIREDIENKKDDFEVEVEAIQNKSEPQPDNEKKLNLVTHDLLSEIKSLDLEQKIDSVPDNKNINNEPIIQASPEPNTISPQKEEKIIQNSPQPSPPQNIENKPQNEDQIIEEDIQFDFENDMPLENKNQEIHKSPEPSPEKHQNLDLPKQAEILPEPSPPKIEPKHEELSQQEPQVKIDNEIVEEIISENTESIVKEKSKSVSPIIHQNENNNNHKESLFRESEINIESGQENIEIRPASIEPHLIEQSRNKKDSKLTNSLEASPDTQDERIKKMSSKMAEHLEIIEDDQIVPVQPVTIVQGQITESPSKEVYAESVSNPNGNSPPQEVRDQNYESEQLQYIENMQYPYVSSSVIEIDKKLVQPNDLPGKNCSQADIQQIQGNEIIEQNEVNPVNIEYFNEENPIHNIENKNSNENHDNVDEEIQEEDFLKDAVLHENIESIKEQPNESSSQHEVLNLQGKLTNIEEIRAKSARTPIDQKEELGGVQITDPGNNEEIENPNNQQVVVDMNSEEGGSKPAEVEQNLDENDLKFLEGLSDADVQQKENSNKEMLDFLEDDIDNMGVQGPISNEEKPETKKVEIKKTENADFEQEWSN